MVGSRFSFLLATALCISACGGGGSPALTPAPTPTPVSQWQSGVYPAASALAARCELPRSGSDLNGNVFPDQTGSAQEEKMWLRSWSNDTYLWYQELPDLDPALFTVLEYFDELKTDELTASGKALDQFHFTADTADYLQRAQSGVSSGYGFSVGLFATDPVSLRVIDSEKNTPATSGDNNVIRGAEIVSIDGEAPFNVVDGRYFLHAGLLPASEGESHTFIVHNLGGTQRTVILASEVITSVPVKNVDVIVQGGENIGYILFNSHIETAQALLVDAVNELGAENIDELVLDLRYNGGGRLSIASEISHMIAGRDATDEKIFERLRSNDKNDDVDIPFFNAWIPPGELDAEFLPELNLNRVFVLTGPATCSASEAIMNSLRGIDIEVIQIGKTTCGKPYAFVPQDNCGTTYFTVQTQGVNDKGFGDYADGFSPINESGVFGERLPGCDVSDDVFNALGDPTEGRFAAALHYIENGTCPSPVSQLLKPYDTSTEPTILGEPQLIGVPEWQTVKWVD